MKPTLIIAVLAITGGFLVAGLSLKKAEAPTTEEHAASGGPSGRLHVERAGGIVGPVTARRAVDLVAHMAREAGPEPELSYVSAVSGVDVSGRADHWQVFFEVPLRQTHVEVEVQPCAGAGGDGDLCLRSRSVRPSPTPDRNTLPWSFRDSPEAVEALVRQGAVLGAGPAQLTADFGEDGQPVWILAGDEEVFQVPFVEGGAPPRYFVLLHSPGPNWKQGTPGMQQPGIQAHVGYMAGHLEAGRLVRGGPFLDDSGGLMILNVASAEEARRIAEEDPGVQSGLLRVVVKPWLAPLGP